MYFGRANLAVFPCSRNFTVQFEKYIKSRLRGLGRLDDFAFFNSFLLIIVPFRNLIQYYLSSLLLFFSYPLFFFPYSHLSSYLLIFIVLFHFCCSHARVYGKTLLHEFVVS